MFFEEISIFRTLEVFDQDADSIEKKGYQIIKVDHYVFGLSYYKLEWRNKNNLIFPRFIRLDFFPIEEIHPKDYNLMYRQELDLMIVQHTKTFDFYFFNLMNFTVYYSGISKSPILPFYDDLYGILLDNNNKNKTLLKVIERQSVVVMDNIEKNICVPTNLRKENKQPRCIIQFREQYNTYYDVYLSYQN